MNMDYFTTLWNGGVDIIYRVLVFFLGILHIKLSDGKKDDLRQFVRFGIVGVSNTVISYVIYVASLSIFRRTGLFYGIDYIISSIIAFFLSVLWAYFWNTKLVFVLDEGEHRSFWASLIKTYISYAFTGLVLNNILLILWVKVIGINEYIAPIMNLLISVPLNFLINKFWAFKGRT